MTKELVLDDLECAGFKVEWFEGGCLLPVKRKKGVMVAFNLLEDRLVMFVDRADRLFWPLVCRYKDVSYGEGVLHLKAWRRGVDIDLHTLEVKEKELQ